MSSSDAALLREIQRLSGAIDRHKSYETQTAHAPSFPNRHSYVNPAIGNRKYVNPAIANKRYVNPALSGKSSAPFIEHGPSRDVVINGVAFESSNRKLTRKDLITNKPESSGSSRSVNSATSGTSRPPYGRKGSNLVPSTRVHKPRVSKRKRLGGRNMVLDNIKGTRTGHVSKRRKVDKQCRFFTMTGVCQRGLTCPYQHDPEKIAICPQFITGSCPNTADTCQLSHDPTPARVPLCHHFANHGRCTREDCPYPHVRVGPREGVCRDFAVVGYCDKGIDCDKQHVRECPDFAEKGLCPKAGCKLPHVIRANKRRQPAKTQTKLEHQANKTIPHQAASVAIKEEYSSNSSSAVIHAAVPATPGAAEEYISLTFEESDDEDEDEDEESDEDADADDAGEDGDNNMKMKEGIED